MAFNALDWVLIGVAAFSVISGFMRGAVSQLFGLAGILGGFFVASHYYEQVGREVIKNIVSLSATSANIISFIVLFILTWFCVAVAGRFIARMLRSVGLGFLDRTWGGILGFGKALILAIAAVSVLTLFAADSSLLGKSVLVPYINTATGYLLKIAPEKVQEEFSKKREDLEKFIDEKQAERGEPVRPPRPEPTQPRGGNQRK